MLLFFYLQALVCRIHHIPCKKFPFASIPAHISNEDSNYQQTNWWKVPTNQNIAFLADSSIQFSSLENREIIVSRTSRFCLHIR